MNRNSYQFEKDLNSIGLDISFSVVVHDNDHKCDNVVMSKGGDSWSRKRMP